MWRKCIVCSSLSAGAIVGVDVWSLSNHNDDSAKEIGGCRLQ